MVRDRRATLLPRSVGVLLALALSLGCPAGAGTGIAAPPAAPANVAAPSKPAAPATPAGEVPTRVRLALPGAPSAVVRDVRLTLVEVIEVASEGSDGAVAYRTIVRLVVRKGDEEKRLDVDGRAEVFGVRLVVFMAGDGETTPGGPRELFAELDVSVPGSEKR